MCTACLFHLFSVLELSIISTFLNGCKKKKRRKIFQNIKKLHEMQISAYNKWNLKYSHLPGGLRDKRSTCQCRRHKTRDIDPWLRKSSWSRKWQLTPLFLPEKFHGQRILAGHSSWGCKELDTTEHTHTASLVYVLCMAVFCYSKVKISQ